MCPKSSGCGAGFDDLAMFSVSSNSQDTFEDSHSLLLVNNNVTEGHIYDINDGEGNTCLCASISSLPSLMKKQFKLIHR